jgi:DMSO/TMAO reductase YedYZ molybdopterin-dependent catalytic subunit
MVDNPLTLSLGDLRNNYEPRHEFVTLTCVSNPVGGDLVGTTLWTGVSLQDVLADVGVQPDATHIEITSADGFHEAISLDLIGSDGRIILVYYWDGQPLQPEHGYPLRVYIPDRFGMKQPKWIKHIEVLWRERLGFWVIRGWDDDAFIKATSVIDTVAVDAASGDPLRVPIGGMALAGARGISKVEVRVDSGEWVEASLRAPLSEVSWVIWRYDWPFAAGEHVFEVRCFDGNGVEQIAEDRPPPPSGSTGIHSVTTTL